MNRAARCLTTTAVLALAVSTAGCGDGQPGRRTLVDSSPATPISPSRTTTDEIDRSDNPASAYLRWVDALARHDAATACDLQAPDFTIQLRYDAILLHRAELGDPCVDFEAIVWEDADFDSTVADVEVTQVTEEDALLDARLGSGSMTVRMVYHRAHWRVFSTSDRTDTGATGDATGPGRWVAAWCGLSPDDTREEVIAAMGAPSGEYTVSDGGEPQLWWAQDQYDFRADLDPVDGSVLELVGDYDALSADDRAQLTCPELRR